MRIVGRMAAAALPVPALVAALLVAVCRAMGEAGTRLQETQQAPSLMGLPTASDTYKPEDQGTAWPQDGFVSRVAGHQSPAPIDVPAQHSYDGDGNMEALTVFGPFSRPEDRTNLGGYTGAVGPAGGSTPESHPELTAP